MAFRRYRRIRRVPRIRRRRFRGSALRKVKRDILKCNFPTKVKFIGLPEKKVMFLTEQTTITTTTNEEGKYGDQRTLYLYPTRCKNFRTLCKSIELKKKNNVAFDPPVKAYISNWDKYCVLAVYIRVQPQINMFAGGEDGNRIVPIKCFYSLNNNVIFDMNSTSNGFKTNREIVSLYNEQMLVEKPLFTFNSNEHFTFVLRAPQTMQTDTPVVHKRYTWWSIVDQALITLGDTSFAGSNNQLAQNKLEEFEETEEPEENEFLPFSTPIINYRSKELPAIHCGHLYFTTEDGTNVDLNVTINYKIALKG